MAGSRIKKKQRQENDEGLSDDEFNLREDRDKYRAEVYQHFHPAEIIRNEKGEKLLFKGNVRYAFKCKKNPSEIVVRHRGNDSTSCLLTHVRKCEPEATASRDIMEQFASGCTYQNEEFHLLCLKWIINGCRPYSIVEDKELRMMFQMCFNNVKIPHQNTISRHIKIFYSMCFKKVVATLRNYNGAVHIGLDAWTAGNGTPFLGVTLHRCIDGAVQSTVLDFIHLTENHTGYYLATEVQKCLVRFGLESKLCALAGDNASNNEKMIRCLALRLEGWGGKTNQVRCLGHILSLAMQAFLKPFTKRGSLDNGDQNKDLEAIEEPRDEVDQEAVSCHTTNGIRSDGEFLKEVETEHADDVQKIGSVRDKERREGISMLTKCTSLAKAINKSDEKKRAYKTSFKTVRECEPEALKRAVETRWNSHGSVILQQRKFRDVIVHLCSSSVSKKLNLDKFLLTPIEWSITDDMEDILETFIEATLFVSQDSVPLVYLVIPLVDNIYEVLADAQANVDKHMLVRHASGCALVVLDKYKALINKSDIYKVAMILHPRYKSEYFKQRKWSDANVEKAVNVARKIWQDRYQPATVEASNTAPSKTNTKKRLFKDLDDFDNSSSSSSTDAFEMYIASPVIKSVKDPLKYWDAQQKANADDGLAQFALDYLSAPASSIDVERAFSLGGKVITKLRNRLSEESARTSIVLASWLEYPAFSAEKEMKQKLSEMWSRKKKKQGKNMREDTAEMDEDDDGMNSSLEESNNL